MSQKLVHEGIYILYSKGEVVYIGESDSIYSRIGDHIREGVKEFDSFDIYETPDRKNLESFLINAFHPKYNVQKPNYKWSPRLQDDLFTKSGIDSAISTYEESRKTISLGEIADSFGRNEKRVLVAIMNHQSEVPAWKHSDGYWQVDYDWFKENSALLKEWVEALPDDTKERKYPKGIILRKDGIYRWCVIHKHKKYLGYSSDLETACEKLRQKKAELGLK